jgi:hypothetical protein
MFKTITKNTFTGTITTKLRLDDHDDWKAIVIVAQNGKSTKNQWGGFPVRNVGKPAYIQRIWEAVA